MGWERHALKIEGGADLQVFSVWSVQAAASFRSVRPFSSTLPVDLVRRQRIESSEIYNQFGKTFAEQIEICDNWAKKMIPLLSVTPNSPQDITSG
jgi:hypothetical protein